MKRVLFLMIVVIACSKESSVGPAQSSTFVRYFNGTNDDQAQALLETSDKQGLVILATSTISTGATPYSKIKLILTDQFGNQKKQALYPSFADDNNGSVSYVGRGIAATTEGYIIVGDDIQSDGTAKLLLITVNKELNLIKKETMTLPPVNGNPAKQRKGYGVALNTAGNFMVLATIPDTLANNMMLGEFSQTSLKNIWMQKYGAGDITQLPNKLFVNSQGASYWAVTTGTKNAAGTELSDTFVRYIKAIPNRQSTVFAKPLGVGQANESTNDITPYGNGFAIVGSSLGKIVLKRVTEGGSVLLSQTYPFTDDPTKTLTGNSVCVAQDGGLVMLATLDNLSKDYCLIKIDAFGSVDATGKTTPTWTKVYGGRFEDVGASIITTSDGGHVVLGTTTLANVKTVLLMKTDKDGQIQ